MYFFKRILGMIPLLIFVSFLAFMLVHSAPGGPFDKERKPAAPEIEKNLQKKYHLDEPSWKQYLRYMGVLFEKSESGNLQLASTGVLQGDFGPSLKYRNHTVADIIKQGLPISLTLGLLAFCFALGIGIPLGCYTALQRGKLGDHIGSFFALLAFCIPSFVVGPVLIMLFAIKWKFFPVAFWQTPMHVILPTIALGLYFSGRISRLMREGMSNTLHSEFIATARAKGLSEGAMLWKHAFRLAVLPVVSYSGPLLADLLTGSFIVETFFQIPGIGTFFVNSVMNRDYTMEVGLVLLYAMLLLIFNLLVDLAYSLLDPRIRYE